MNRHKRNASPGDLLEGQVTVWHLLSRFTVTLIVLAGLAVALTFFIPELDRQKRLSREIEILEKKRAVALEKRNRRRDELRWLNDDPDYLELRARDKLDLYVPGETILNIEEAEKEEQDSAG